MTWADAAARPFDGVIFDLDGTLLDTLEDIGNAANSVLQHHGFPPHPIHAYRQFVGDGVRLLMTRALPPDHRDEATLQACLQTMQGEYRRFLNRTARPYEGVPELLRTLKTNGFRLAVLSNKADEFTGPCVLDRFGPNLFEPILGLRNDRPRKPDPAGALEIADAWRIAPARIAYLGDSGTDMLTARAAGMLAIGVLWGYRDEEELRRSGAQHLIQTPQEFVSRPSDPLNPRI